MVFQWQDSPEIFVSGMEAWTTETMETLFALCQDYAQKIQAWMRANAPWVDDCLPSREYLRADAWRDDETLQVGIVAYYDLETYRASCPEPPFDFGWAHETFTFKKAGVIAIISTRGNPSVLGDMADELWDHVRSLYA